MTPIQKNNFISDWRALSAKRGVEEHTVASFFRKLQKTLPDRTEFMLFCTVTLEMTPVSASKHWRMAGAAAQVDDVHVWRAIGWPGVSLLTQVKQKDNFDKIAGEVRKLADGDSLPRSKWYPIFERIVPDVCALQKRRARTASNPNVEKKRAELLAAAVRKLVEAAPILRGILTPKQLAEAGLSSKATKTA